MEHDLYLISTFLTKEKCIILTHAMYCWLLLQIYRVTYDWFLWSKVTFRTSGWESLDKIPLVLSSTQLYWLVYNT